MKTLKLVIICILLFQTGVGQELDIDFPYIKHVEYQSNFQVDFARYGLCQLRYELKDTENGLKTIKNAERLIIKLDE